MARLSALGAQAKLTAFIKERSKSDWLLCAALAVLFVGLLALASSITPYKEPLLKAFYHENSAQTDAAYLRAEAKPPS